MHPRHTAAIGYNSPVKFERGAKSSVTPEIGYFVNLQGILLLLRDVGDRENQELDRSIFRFLIIADL